MIDLGASQAIAASADGTVIVGGSFVSGPVKWAGSTTPTAIPNLPGVVILPAAKPME